MRPYWCNSLYCIWGFSPEALASRISDCKAVLVVTADEGPRGGKNIPLKKNVDAALDICGDVTTLVVARTGHGTPYKRAVIWIMAR